MKIYTRTGDEGETGLFGGPRVLKDDVRIEAYGTIDELNAAVGCLRNGPIFSGKYSTICLRLGRSLRHRIQLPTTLPWWAIFKLCRWNVPSTWLPKNYLRYGNLFCLLAVVR